MDELLPLLPEGASQISNILSVIQTAEKTGVKYSTLSKAVQDERIKYSKPETSSCTDKSARSVQDTTDQNSPLELNRIAS